MTTMALERKEWAVVLRTLLTRDYWAGRCTSAPGYTWYLDRLKATVDAARLATGSDQVCSYIRFTSHPRIPWLGGVNLAPPLSRG